MTDEVGAIISELELLTRVTPGGGIEASMVCRKTVNCWLSMWGEIASY